MLCHKKEMSAQRRHTVFDGVNETEQIKGRGSLNILSLYVKTCVICVWKKLVLLQGIAGAWTVASRNLCDGVTRTVSLCLCV